MQLTDGPVQCPQREGHICAVQYQPFHGHGELQATKSSWLGTKACLGRESRQLLGGAVLLLCLVLRSKRYYIYFLVMLRWTG
ncbi:hypothetical protein DL95DRAFT_390999 [Leptodontidium sp. 2 PMI_412]|nr:hypothetical protein DL95DRAFT_390999 [Leptodontidium sp. 2 PMI_412]